MIRITFIEKPATNNRGPLLCKMLVDDYITFSDGYAYFSCDLVQEKIPVDKIEQIDYTFSYNV